MLSEPGFGPTSDGAAFRITGLVSELLGRQKLSFEES